MTNSVDNSGNMSGGASASLEGSTGQAHHVDGSVGQTVGANIQYSGEQNVNEGCNLESGNIDPNSTLKCGATNINNQGGMLLGGGGGSIGTAANIVGKSGMNVNGKQNANAASKSTVKVTISMESIYNSLGGGSTGKGVFIFLMVLAGLIALGLLVGLPALYIGKRRREQIMDPETQFIF
jgi:hypothetical protein